MLKRLIAIMFVGVFAVACSSSDDMITDGTGVDVTTTPPGYEQDGTYSYDRDGASSYDLEGGYGQGASAQAGTQEDLIINIGDRVYYSYDSSSLDAESRIIVEKQAQWLKSYPHISVTIEGHADERGTREYNLALGERRANAVKNYLVGLGINPERVTVTSYGKERPAVLGSTPLSWSRNRRGVMVVN